MKQILTIAWREFRVRATSKLYLTLTAITFTLVVCGPLAVSTLLAPSAIEPLRLAVYDETQWLMPTLRETLQNQNAIEGDPVVVQTLFDFKTIDKNQIPEQLSMAQANEIDGLLRFQYAAEGQLQVLFSSTSSLTIAKVKNAIEPHLKHLVVSELIRDLNVDESLRHQMLNPTELDYVQLSNNETRSIQTGNVIVASVFNLLIFVSIMLYANMTFQGVLEEKNSRIMEVMLSAAPANTLIAGKILGIGLLGLVQILTWLLPYAMVTSLPLPHIGEALAVITPSVMAYMLVFFVLGYLLFSSLFAAVGSGISRIEDSQAATTPLTMVIMFGYFASVLVLYNPTSSAAQIASFIPFFTPTAMFSRLILSDVPTWQIAISIAGMALTIGLAVLASGRIYRAGVLHYGAKPKLSMLYKSMSQSEA